MVNHKIIDMNDYKTALNSNVSSLNADIKCLDVALKYNKMIIFTTSLLQTNWLNRVSIMVPFNKLLHICRMDHNN